MICQGDVPKGTVLIGVFSVKGDRPRRLAKRQLRQTWDIIDE